jgi:hypothetical protein
MHRLLYVACLGALACGSGSETGGADAGSAPDVSSDVPQHCVVDFPCDVPWSCSDSTHWVEMQSVAKPPCTGLTCESTGVTHECDPGLECVTDPNDDKKDPCAYGGHDGCLPADEGAFSPPPIDAPVKQQGVCDDATIQLFWSQCVDTTTADQAKCNAVANGNPSCSQCLSRTFTWVPTTNSEVQSFPNVSGCYATLEGTSAPGSCAARADARLQCAIASCAACEAWADDAFETCVDAATAGACAAFATCDADAGAAYATCEASSSKDFFLGFGEALCGP